MMKAHKIFSGLFVISGLIALIVMGSPPSEASVNFGTGLAVCPAPIQPVVLSNPTVITNCTQAGVQAALNSGGHIRFSCGPNPVTIPISSQLEFNPQVSTVIDGEGLVTLDGQGSSRIFNKEWHNYNTVGPVTITIQNMRLINAKAPGGNNHSGGAIRVGYSGTRLHVINSTFVNNRTTAMTTSDNRGGAIFVHNAAETIIVGSVFDNNAAGSGGAFGGIATDLLIYNSRFVNNQASDTTSGGIVRGYGGAIGLDGVDKTFQLGGSERVQVCGSSFENNTAVRGGGAIESVVSDNFGTKTVIEKSSFVDNEVTGLNGEYGQGGAIYIVEDDRAGGAGEDNLEIIDSTFHGNLARRQGGAVWFTILGQGRIVNSTFEGNRTTAPFNQVGQGGAMAIGGNQILILNSTFANNHAAYQGGAIHGGGSSNQITLKNTIFVNNTLNYGQTVPSETRWQGYHTNRTMIDGGQNIQFPRNKPQYNNDVNNLITNNPIFLDPLLGVLADNGGPTLTMAPLEGSPAINAGASGCPAADQRGVLREGACDIGAVEYKVRRLDITPPTQAIGPGETAAYELEIFSSSTITQPLTLSVTNPYGTLTHSFSAATILPGQTVTLELTDTHGGSTLIPGAWYAVDIEATNGDITLSAVVTLLAGGEKGYLPVVVR